MTKESLAINGGTPVRENRIGYGRQWIEEDDIEAVCRVLRSDSLTCGPNVTALEKALCDYTGAKYGVAVSNGTAALHCACIAAGLKPGDELITTPITFAASANCALYCGAKVVFADIDPENYNIDPKSIEAKITEKTRAVVAVDFTGQPVDTEAIREICDKHNLIFIEDAAHSIGSSRNGKMVGSIADITTFSFHPVKTITGGEGGAVMTNDAELYKRIVLAHAHGITRDPSIMEEEHDGPWYYEQVSLGYNYRLTDIQSVLILSQLGKIERFKARRMEIVKRYNEELSKVPGIIIQKDLPGNDTCRHLYIIRLDLEKFEAGRTQIFNALVAEGIGCQIHYVPTYYFPHYKRLGHVKGECPVAEEIYEGIISIPLFPKMTDDDVTDVITAIRKVTGAYLK